MHRSLTIALVVGSFLFSAPAASHEPFSVAAKKSMKKKKKKKEKFTSTGVPAYDKIFEHNVVMLEIIKKNIGDCWKVVAELEAYGNKYMKEYKKLAQQRSEAVAAMSSKERQVYDKNVEQRLWEISQKYWDLFTDIDNKCPLNKNEILMYLRIFK